MTDSTLLRKPHYVSVIIDAKTFSGYEGGLSRQGCGRVRLFAWYDLSLMPG
jgi:hypothetical protein